MPKELCLIVGKTGVETKGARKGCPATLLKFPRSRQGEVDTRQQRRLGGLEPDPFLRWNLQLLINTKS